MSISQRLSRRRVLALAGAAAVAGIGMPRLVYAQNLKPVNFTLPWVADGSNLYTYVAKEMGFWQKHGLDVSIARGSGSVGGGGDRRGQFRFRPVCPARGDPPSRQGTPDGGARTMCL